MTTHIPIRSLCLVLAGLLAGCQESGPRAETFATVPAKGTLTHNGKPLPHYQVMLVPAGKRPAAGTTDEQGHFVLGTNVAGDGAVTGSQKVVVTFVGPPGGLAPDQDGYKPPTPPVKLPGKYGSAQTTDVTVEIPEQGAEDLKIDLKF